MPILFQELPNIISLGPVGTILYTVVALILGLIVWRQRNWRSAAEAASSSREAAIAEMNVHKETCERIRAEQKELRDENAKLKALTDLAPLISAQQTNTEIIKQWVLEGRDRFDSARDALKVNTGALTALVEEVKAQRVTSESSYRTITNAFMEHTIEDKQVALEANQNQARLINAIEELERRMSLMAVQVGVVTWKDKESNQLLNRS